MAEELGFDFCTVETSEHLPIEGFARGQALAGTPNDVVVGVQHWRDEVNPDSMELMITGPQDYESVRDMLQLFGCYVIPCCS